jgi:hypothetical protein
VALGRIFIACMTGLFSYLILTRVEQFKGTVTYPEAPAFLCAMVGFTIGSNFMAIYGIASDAILFVFCIEEEIEKSTKIKTNRCPQVVSPFYLIF